MLKLEMLQPGEGARQTGRQKQGGGGENPGIVRSNLYYFLFFFIFLTVALRARTPLASYLSTYLLYGVWDATTLCYFTYLSCCDDTSPVR